MLHRYMACTWEKKASGWHIYKRPEIAEFLLLLQKSWVLSKMNCLLGMSLKPYSSGGWKGKICCLQFNAIFFSQMLAAWWWMGCGRGAQRDSVQQQWQMRRPDCMYSQYSYIHSQQHSCYAFLSTFLLKSLPGSSLWSVLFQKTLNPKPSLR